MRDFTLIVGIIKTTSIIRTKVTLAETQKNIYFIHSTSFITQFQRQWKFSTNLVEFYHILIFNSLQFCTRLVQNFFLSLSIKQIPLFHIPKIAYKKAIRIRKFSL